MTRVIGTRRAAALAGATLAAVIALGPRSLAQSPDPAARVAAFDAAWRLVRDTHFDPTFGGVDWDAVGRELRPRAEAAATDAELRAVVEEMLGRLGQSHFVLLPAGAVDDEEGAAGGGASGDPGLDVRLLDGRVVVSEVRAGGPAESAGVRPGWSVDAVDGLAVDALLGRLPASLDSRAAGLEAWRAVTRRLRGPSGAAVRLELDDGVGERRTIAVTRAPEPGEPVTVGSLPPFRVRFSRRWEETPAGHRAGVIRFNVWLAQIGQPFADAIEAFGAADGLVIDLRGNPGGLAALLMGIAGYVLDEPVALGRMRMREGEMRFVANPRRVNARGERTTPYAGPVAILVDGLTGSASECFAGGLQSLGRARVFGERTMGQALPALFDRLPNGDVLIHAYGDFVTSSGERLEGRGVTPDEPTPLTRADLAGGVDRALAAALAWIDRTGG